VCSNMQIGRLQAMLSMHITARMIRHPRRMPVTREQVTRHIAHSNALQSTRQ
jgi:hypothetical protein